MNKTVLITGSSRGIGRETALYLANKGYDIVLHCHSNIQKAEETAKEIELSGQKARILQFNIADRIECKNVITDDIENDIFEEELNLMRLRRKIDTRIEPHLIRIEDYKNVETPLIQEIIDTGIKVA